MKLSEDLYLLFDRENYTYRIGDETTKKEFVDQHSLWIAWCLELSKSNPNFSEPVSQGWQNSGQLLRYFWTRYKFRGFEDSSVCISLHAASKGFSIELSYEIKKENSTISRKEYNQLVMDNLDGWVKSQNIDKDLFYISVNSEKNKCTLSEYYSSLEKRNWFKSMSENVNINVGVSYSKSQIDDIDTESVVLIDILNKLTKFYEIIQKPNGLFERLKNAQELIPDEHDGSYELVRETVNAYKKVPSNNINLNDLDALFFMSVGTWRMGVDRKKDRIDASNLPDAEKIRIKKLLDEVNIKAKNGKYSNSTDGFGNIGMFGVGFMTFNKSGNSDESAKAFIKLCIDISEMSKDEEIFSIVQLAFEKKIQNIAAGSASTFLHCLKPFVFPIINGKEGEGQAIYQELGIKLSNISDIRYYIQNAKAIKKFRDENFKFKNYRIFDLLRLTEETEPEFDAKRLNIWKVSHGKDFTESEQNLLLENNVIVVHGETKAKGKSRISQGETFINNAKIGDYFYLCFGNKGIKVFGKISSDPEPYSAKGKGWMKRSYSIVRNSINPNSKYVGEDKWWAPKNNSTFVLVGNSDLGIFEREILLPYFELTLGELIDSKKSSYWWLNAKPSHWSFNEINVGETISYYLHTEKGNKRKVFDNYLNARRGDIVIGYETSPSLEIACLLEVEKEQDGSTISFKKTRDLNTTVAYSEFSNIPELKNMEFLLQKNGSFFKLRTEEFEVLSALFEIDDEVAEKPKSEYEEYFKENFLKDVYMLPDEYDRIIGLLKHKKNIILQGAPGVGKSYLAQKLAYSILGEKDTSRVSMIQFHQSYSYEDFIEGYRPKRDAEGFELREGVFKAFCNKAKNDLPNDYYFIIDEINRGNLSKIFGELMLLIEGDKRSEEYKMTTTYGSRNFYVPENLYIIGLMNTADRSLAMLDYALRRRFCFVSIEPAFENPDFIAYLKKGNSDVGAKILEKMMLLNSVIQKDLGAGFKIGHSFFCNCSEITEDWYERILNYEILPLLEEYWFDSDEKFQARKRELLS